MGNVREQLEYLMILPAIAKAIENMIADCMQQWKELERQIFA
jgi:hypothetical protein